MSKVSKVAWPLVVAVALVSFAGCQAIGYVQHGNIVSTCIENGGTWVGGVGNGGVRTPDQCIMGEE